MIQSSQRISNMFYILQLLYNSVSAWVYVGNDLILSHSVVFSVTIYKVDMCMMPRVLKSVQVLKVE